MPQPSVVLVVGTTPDYIDWIRQGLPGKALFLTDPMMRETAREPRPAKDEEILCNLADEPRVLPALFHHLDTHSLQLSGITSFDCGSILLAARMAKHLGLPYCTPESVLMCQNKELSKRIWRKSTIFAPRSEKIENQEQLIAFYKRTKGPLVIKPQNGTGSELVFLCADETQCIDHYKTILRHMNMAAMDGAVSENVLVTAEEYISGEEFSCDFIISAGCVRILRICRKIIAKQGPMGTAMAYVLLPINQTQVSTEILGNSLWGAAAALGISHALCMADFIIREGKIHFLEITPRPGGDCLPYLLKRAWNLDIIALTMAFAQGKEILWQGTLPGGPVVGLRIHAGQNGVLKGVDFRKLKEDHRILEFFHKRDAGHRIVLPPDDYDSWVLGHVIFIPHDHIPVEDQCRQIMEKIEIRME